MSRSTAASLISRRPASAARTMSLALGAAAAAAAAHGAVGWVFFAFAGVAAMPIGDDDAPVDVPNRPSR